MRYSLEPPFLKALVEMLVGTVLLAEIWDY